MSNKLSNPEDKVKFILTLFEYYQPKLTIAEQISLLDKWLKSCIIEEEYEMAKAIKDKSKYVLDNMENVPQRLEGGIDLSFMSNGPLNFGSEFFNEQPMVEEEVVPIKKQKLSIYSKITSWIIKKFYGIIKKFGNT